MPKKLVIFDLDNTLVITKPAAKEGYKQAINVIARGHNRYHDHKKLYNHWKKIVQKVMGEKKPQMRRFAYSLKLLLDEHELPTTHYQEALNRYERVLLEELEVQRGAKDLLSWLNEDGYLIAIATASAKHEAKKKLKKTELEPFIDILVTSNDTETMKPDSRYYQLILEESGAKPVNTVVVGDSQKEDLDPAKKIGLKTILLPNNNLHLNTVKDQILNLIGAGDSRS